MEKAHPTRWAFFMGEALPALCANKQAKANQQEGARRPLHLTATLMAAASPGKAPVIP